MSEFTYINNDLYCEGVLVADIADKVDTPFFLYSRQALINRFQELKEAFKVIDPLICFAMKANDNLAVIKTLVNQGAGFDIVSLGELKKAKLANGDMDKIVFASVGKTDEEIRESIKAGILFFNVESFPELERIQSIAKEMDKQAPVALRINPDVEAPTHKHITTGSLKNKFGIDLKTVRKIMKNKNQYDAINFVGLHCHIGSQILKTDPFKKALTRVVEFINELKEDGIELQYLDIGGGLGIQYENEKAPTAKQFAKVIVPILKETNLKVIIEPGRYIAGNAGIYVTKVLYLKDNGVKKFLIVDGGMNDLIRPSLYQAYHEIQPVRKRPGKKQLMDIVGPICESGDYLGKERKMPMMEAGELVATFSAGAYGFVMASNYNVRSRAAEVIVKEKKFGITRKSESFRDLIKGESIPEFIRY